MKRDQFTMASDDVREIRHFHRIRGGSMSKAQFLAENLMTGETYAGLILGKDGQPDYHLFLLAAKPEIRLNWDDAKAWASAVGGELPTRREQSILFANCREHFESAWYWSCEQAALNDAYDRFGVCGVSVNPIGR